MTIKPAARTNDPHICTQTSTSNVSHVGGFIISGSNNITINNNPAARVGDLIKCSENSTGTITTGSNVVTFNNKPAARKTSLTSHDGIITEGSTNVFIGNTGNPVAFGNMGIIELGNTGTIYIGGASIEPTNNRPTQSNYRSTFSKLIKKPLLSPYPGTLIIKFINDYDGYAKKQPAKYVEGSNFTLTYPNKDQKPIIIKQKISQEEIIINNYDLNNGFILQTQFLCIAINNNPITPTTEIIDFGISHKNVKEMENKRVLFITALTSPIIINLRNENSSQPVLTNEQLNYFKGKGNNATIFIHGFNIAFGNYAMQPQANQLFKEMAIIPNDSSYSFYDINKNERNQQQAILHHQPGIKYSLTNISKNLIGNIIPHLEPPHLKPIQFAGLYLVLKLNNYTDNLEEIANGTGAHNWFVHMEDNLNRATNQFNATDYRSYTRLINIAWSGNVDLPTNYMQSVNNANNAGIKLVPLIQQLKNAGLTINIMAHSAGNIVLLRLLDQLGKQANDYISHAFLWEPAVPNDALTDKATNNTNQYNFSSAHYAVKKFIVLYSRRDNILGPQTTKVINTFRDLQAKLMDPTAGFEIALTIGIINCIDKFDPPNHFSSVYNLANMFNKPLSYFFSSELNCETYYNNWINPKQNHQYRQNGNVCAFDHNFYQQITKVKYDYPKLFAQLYIILLAIKQGNMNNIWPLEKQLILDILKERHLKRTANTYKKQADDLELRERLSKAGESITLTEISTDEFITMIMETSKQISLLYKQEVNIFRHHITKNLTNRIICSVVTIIISVLVSTNVKVKPAMGYSGPDKYTQKLLYKKLQLIPQQDDDNNDLLTSHSAMKIPTKIFMEKIYKQKIWRENKDFQFGNYLHQTKEEEK